MVFYDGFTYIHKLLNFKRVCGKFALSPDIYRGCLYTCHLTLGAGVISAVRCFHVGGVSAWCLLSALWMVFIVRRVYYYYL